MPTDSGGRLQHLANLLTGCFRRKKREEVKTTELKEEPKPNHWIKLPRFRDAIVPYVPKRKRILRKNNSFMQELRKECLLASGSTTSDNPIINICLGFKDEELNYRGQKIYHKSYSRTHWDNVLLNRKGLQRMVSYSTTFNEPIVDDLPASIWMECLEPTLSVLVTLSCMKHRRTNLSLRSIEGRPVNSTVRDSRVRHGDYNRDPWNNLVGPRLVFQDRNVLVPTEEVRPSIMLDFGGAGPITIDIVVQPNGRTTRKNKHRKILTLPARDPYEIEEDEPLAYTFPVPESSDDDDDDSDDDSSTDSDEDESIGFVNINQSANSEQTMKELTSKITCRTTSVENINPDYPITKQKLETWFWHVDIGQYTCDEAEDHTIEEVQAMRVHWLEYLKRLEAGDQLKGDADLLYDGISKDPAYRRLFLKDAVLFLEDIDTNQNDQFKTEKKPKTYEKKLSELEKDVGITVKSISDTSCEQLDIELSPLPKTPIKKKRLQSDDYIICNMIQRKESDLLSSAEEIDTDISSSSWSLQSVETIDSELQDSTSSECQPEDLRRSSNALVILTDTYVLPGICQRQQIGRSKDKAQFSSNLLSVFTNRSFEDIANS